MEVKKPLEEQIKTLKGAEFVCELPKWANRKGVELVSYKTTLILLHKDKEPHYLNMEKKIFLPIESAEILDHLRKIKKKKDDDAAKAKEKKKPAKKKKRPDKIKLKGTHTIQGKYMFSDKEKTEFSGQLARKSIDKSGVEDEKKSVMSDFKDRLDRINMDVNKLSRCIVDGFEYRDFECYIVKDFKAHLKRYYDKHTDNLIDERPLDPSDYQYELGD